MYFVCIAENRRLRTSDVLSCSIASVDGKHYDVGGIQECGAPALIFIGMAERTLIGPRPQGGCLHDARPGAPGSGEGNRNEFYSSNLPSYPTSSFRAPSFSIA